MTPTILSYGLGTESTAILVRWLKDPASRPCALEDLIVLTAQTGDEYEDTRTAVEAHVLPLLREHNIRFVQVGRRGPHEADGITILSDTRQPTRLHIEGDYKLSDELRSAGTVPQFGGTHRCSLKAKAAVLEHWLKHFLHLGEESHAPVRHAYGYNVEEPKRVAKCLEADAQRMAFGFNVEEPKRVARAKEYDTPARVSFFPLVDWNWTREDCLAYLRQQFSITWQKSACVYCPFNSLNPEAIDRHKAHPEQVADAMMLEHVSLSLNPRGTLYAKGSLVQITERSGNTGAIEAFSRKLAASPWGVYRVRRIYQAKKDSDGRSRGDRKGQALRAVEKLEQLTSADQAQAALSRLALAGGIQQENDGRITYAFVQKRGSSYPAREEFFVCAPATVETKARYGMPWFEEQWCASQGNLFQ